MRRGTLWRAFNESGAFPGDAGGFRLTRGPRRARSIFCRASDRRVHLAQSALHRGIHPLFRLRSGVKRDYGKELFVARRKPILRRLRHAQAKLAKEPYPHGLSLHERERENLEKRLDRSAHIRAWLLHDSFNLLADLFKRRGATDHPHENCPGCRSPNGKAPRRPRRTVFPARTAPCAALCIPLAPFGNLRLARARCGHPAGELGGTDVQSASIKIAPRPIFLPESNAASRGCRYAVPVPRLARWLQRWRSR